MGGLRERIIDLTTNSGLHIRIHFRRSEFFKFFERLLSQHFPFRWYSVKNKKSHKTHFN